MKLLIKKYLLIFLGSVSLIFGIIGIFFPVLPTTPFLLLASLCYLKSSRFLYEWLINHKIFKPIIKNYMEHKAILRRTKIYALIFLWISLIISMLLISNIYLSLVLSAIGIGVSIFLLSINTIDESK
jgi:uncharacterized membrane protein YbaN (DUF454 family)